MHVLGCAQGQKSKLHLGVGWGGLMRAASAAAGLGASACCARCTMSADMDTVETTADATMASIITLATCMHALSEGGRQSE